MTVGSIDTAQAVSQLRYKQDLPGGLRRAMINQGVITAADTTTGLDGLASLVAPSLGLPANNYGGNLTRYTAYSIMQEIIFALTIWPAP